MPVRCVPLVKRNILIVALHQVLDQPFPEPGQSVIRRHNVGVAGGNVFHIGIKLRFKGFFGGIVVIGAVTKLLIEPAAPINLPVRHFQQLPVERDGVDRPRYALLRGGHALFVAVNILRRQPFRLIGNSVIQFAHLGNLFFNAAAL